MALYKIYSDAIGAASEARITGIPFDCRAAVDGLIPRPYAPAGL